MSNSELLLIVVVLVCFALGYWIVSILFKNKSASKGRGGSREYYRWTEPSESDPSTSERPGFRSTESHYRRIIGVSDLAEEHEIRTAYRLQLARYHPDKVTHLGDEFQALASRRTKEIIEAYDFLKDRYHFK